MTMTQLDIHPCDSLSRSGWSVSNDVANGHELDNQPQGVFSPPSTIRTRFPAALTGGSAPGTMEYSLPTKKRAIQVIGAHFIPVGFEPHPGTGILKQFLVWNDTTNPAGRIVMSTVWNGSSWRPSIGVQGVPSPLGYAGTVPIKTGSFYLTKMQAYNSGIGSSDGTVRVYVDRRTGLGWELAQESTTQETVPTGSGNTNNDILQHTNVWGGTGGSVAALMFAWLEYINVQVADALNELTDPVIPPLRRRGVTGGAIIGNPLGI